MPSPPFGTASAYTDSFPYPPPSTITISSETCYNLAMIKQYRKLDDQVIIRLNRAQAQLRDQSRIAKTSSDGNAAMCLTIWNEIMCQSRSPSSADPHSFQLTTRRSQRDGHIGKP
ncbi:hypothetical protein P7C73_g296, partial [Tremellales sp. Uapishka_1]